MGCTGKSESEGYWGMGFLLVFFPEENHHDNGNNNSNKKKIPNNTSINLFSSSSSSSSPSPSPLSSSLNKRTNNSAHIHLLHKAQSTISICLLLLFTTLLLFTLSTLPSPTNRHIYTVPTRHHLISSSTRIFFNDEFSSSSSIRSPNSSVQRYALQGMGTLYRRGTRAMPDLIVAHAVQSLTSYDLKLFLRLLCRSSLTSRSDLLFIFPSKTADFDHAILRENESFMKLILTHHQKNNTGFDPTHFLKLIKKDKDSGEPIWGRRTATRSYNSSEEEGDAESTRPSYGSVVGFEVEELDPENSLSGFLDHVPMSLRRWACYPMLLGRVRRNFKHIMLVDIKEMLVVGDPLGRVRTQRSETVLVVSAAQLSKHGRKNLATRQKPAHPGFIAGGSRGVRRLSNAMLTDIVRASMQPNKKKKNPVTESGLFNQLVENDFVLRNVNLIKSTESIPDLGSLVGSHPKTGAHLFASNNYTVIRRGNSNLSVTSVVMKHTCSFPIDSTVYSDC